MQRRLKDREIISLILKEKLPPLPSLCGYPLAPVGTMGACLHLQGTISWSLNIGCIPATLEILGTRKICDTLYLNMCIFAAVFFL